MTAGEVIDWIDGATIREEHEIEAQRLLAWRIGYVNMFSIASSLSADASYPSFEEMFPRPKTEAETEAAEEAEWKMHRIDLITSLERGEGHGRDEN